MKARLLLSGAHRRTTAAPASTGLPRRAENSCRPRPATGSKPRRSSRASLMSKPRICHEIPRRFFIRLSNFTAGRRADRRLREEMAEHLALQTEENLRAGMSPAEARRQAALQLGSAPAIREDHHAEQGLPLIENFLFDLKYAVRMLGRAPGFSLIAIAIMALGIGATTAIFSVVDATLLRPLSYPRSDQLVRIEDDLPGAGALDAGLSVPELKDFQRSGIFQYVSGDWSISGNLTGSSQPLRIPFKMVAPNYFALLGVNPQLGRTFDPHDETPGFNLEVVISDGLWRRAFGV